MTDIKEERFQKDDIKDPFDVINPPALDEGEERTLDFWQDIDGIIELLNRTDPKHTNTTIESPAVLQFLIWRLLTETKELKIAQKKVTDIIEKKEEIYSRKDSRAI